MDTRFSLTLDQIDEIQKHLRRAHAISKLVAECGAGRQWPEDFTAMNLGTVMHVIVEDIEQAQGVIRSCTEKGAGNDTDNEPTG